MIIVNIKIPNIFEVEESEESVNIFFYMLRSRIFLLKKVNFIYSYNFINILFYNISFYEYDYFK